MYDGLCEIPKELIEIVQVAESAGSDIRSVQHVPTHLVARRQLEFTVGITAAVGKREYSRCSAGNRGYNEVIRGVALLVGDPQQQAREKLAVEFQIPRGAAGVSKFADYFIPIKQRAKFCAVLAEHGHRATWKIREGGRHERNAVIEQPDAALQQRPSVAGQG